jgi:tRNA (guanine-N7-)-methyltransferase
MRKRPNLVPRLERCAEKTITSPEQLRGKWRETYPDFQEIHIELGCGKGKFTRETALQNPNALLIAFEKVPDAIVVAMERADNQRNLRFIIGDAQKLAEIFAPGEVLRIYINFCDPWPKKKNAKRRLTAPGFLEIYKQILSPGGEIRFKTDNNALFDYSLETLEQAGFDVTDVTRNLHERGIVGVTTDYEEKFHAQGVLINSCAARIS